MKFPAPEDYIERLKRLVELERKAEIEAMLKEIKRLSGEKREKLGRAILNLDGKVVGEEFGYKLVKYGRARPIKTEIGVGDSVLISRGNPLKSDLIGVVVEKRNRYIVVALESVPNWALKNVRVDLYASDVTFRRMIENLDNLSEWGYRALEFLLGLRKPEEPVPLEFEPMDSDLNESQRRAVSLALGSEDFFLIHGPFGTGKTRTLVELVVQEVRRGNKVLATAESNVAVDNLVERLVGKVDVVRVGHPSRVSKDLKDTTLASLTETHPDFGKARKLREEADKLIVKRDEFLKPVPQLRRGLSDEEILKLAKRGRGARGLSPNKIASMAKWIELNERIGELIEEAKRIVEGIEREILEDADVVLSTNSTSFLVDLKFDVAVIDEATQATIPSVLIPIAKARRFVLAGDHKQLPPTILSEEAKELEVTMFEKLMERFPQNSEMLDVQYRMNEKIMRFPNEEFYGGRLKADESVKDITLSDLGVEDPEFGSPWDEILDPKEPLVFVDTSKCPNKWERQRKGSFSRENPLEAEIVKEIVDKSLKMGVKGDWIGVITPYEDQVDLLRSILGEIVEINTVDGYQGREKEVIVISFVRSNKKGDLGFLTDLRRLNTALTRAKRKLICIGDAETLSKHGTYRKFVEFVKAEGRLVKLC